MTGIDGGGRPAVALGGEGVLVLPAHSVPFGHRFAGESHRPVLQRAPETVVDHRVVRVDVAHAQALAGLRQEIWSVAQRLHAAGHRDVDVTRRDTLRRQHHRLQAGTADLVDGERGHVIPEPAAERRLAGGRLPQTGRHDVAHDALVDLGRVDAGARDRLTDHPGAEIGGRQAL